MSTLYLASDLRSLAERLADELAEQATPGEFFAPVLVVVPNRYMRKWLRMFLARRLDVAINLDFREMEDGLWHLLEQVDPESKSRSVEAIDENIYRLLVLSVLLEETDQPLAPLQRYLQMDGPNLTRLSCRRAWYLADRVGLLIQDYEYHRQEVLIQPWLERRYALGAASEFHKMMERAQRTLFLHITREPGGKRALLNRRTGRTFKTFPQYAMEFMTGARQAEGSKKGFLSSRVHFFGFTQASDLHTKTIRWLGQFLDIRFYHLNSLAERLGESPTAEVLKSFGETFHQENNEQGQDRGRELARWWGRAGAESLGLVANVLAEGNSEARVLHRPNVALRSGNRRGATAASKSTLARLQEHLLGHSEGNTRLAQDTSLQIVACPGVAREVETLYNSILHNLHLDPTLRQSDIGVLVTDLPKYRASLQAVFERPPMSLQYNMVDFSAAGLSMFGQALIGMLDLALESFSRTRVFSVILNPCFLARLGVDRAQAMVWLEWAESLGIYQGWDAQEKEDQGYPRSPFYAWRLGLQRLRLGRYMEVTREDGDQSAARFGHVIPFADFDSTDREHLDAFCKAVEGLLPMLARLRAANASGQRWASSLQRLIQEFLDVPADRPEEAQVREGLLVGMEKLALWDELHDPGQKPAGMPLALVREYVQGQLEMLEGNRGEYLIGGVTISALKPMRPMPFEIIYVLGLDETLFPGSNALSSFDLRGAQRAPGDIRPAEERVYDFFASVLAAGRKLYLSYNNHDLQKDQPLLPATVLLQTQRYLNRHILKKEFQPSVMPVHGDDERFLDAAQQPEYQDVLVQYREAERSLALSAASKDGRLSLDLSQQAEWAERSNELKKDFSIESAEAKDDAPDMASSAKTELPSTVTLSELRGFLQLPAYASLRRHLHVEEEEERIFAEEEPLVTPELAANALLRQTLQQVVLSGTQGDLEKALTTWQDRFAQTYADSRMRSQAPEEAFGEIDCASLKRDLQERIHGQGQIEMFLRQHAGLTFCGPVLLGESLTPIGAKLRFPALRFRVGHELPAEAPREIRLVGSMPFAWHSANRFEMLMITNIKEFDGRKVSRPLLEPALFHLALLANAEPNAQGIASQEWLAKREVVLHLAHCKGIQTWTYPAGLISASDAKNYLVELAHDFLDPTQFDLLPFEILIKKPDLQRAFDSNLAMQTLPDDYRKMLEEAILEEREDTFRPIKIPLLVDMIGARVPADALAKVQRRLRLLDRGPARFRQQPPVPRTRKTAKT